MAHAITRVCKANGCDSVARWFISGFGQSGDKGASAIPTHCKKHGDAGVRLLNNRTRKNHYRLIMAERFRKAA